MKQVSLFNRHFTDEKTGFLLMGNIKEGVGLVE